ncbi:MAG: hypothetical protein K0U20_09475 [Proteobacteria bacterium]|nr:hypothetical protein [Pseudomonadota bacterium]MCH9735756.1 hypothetical protein [Actinomycetes bacterium]
MIESVMAMGGGAVTGFIFQLIANHQHAKQQEYKLLLKGHELQEKSIENARNSGGIWMKRFAVFIMISLFAYISIGSPETATNLVKYEDGPSFLWGLVELAGETVVVPVEGMIMDDTLRVSVLTIMSFLFGANVGEQK